MRLVVRARGIVSEEIQQLDNERKAMSVIQRAVFAGAQLGMICASCEVVDTPDPEIKIFRFKEWSKDDFNGHEVRPNGKLCSIIVHEQPRWGMDLPGRPNVIGRYRVTAELETPHGYVAAYEATTKPEPETPKEAPGTESSPSLAAEEAIMSVLETVGRMTLRDLKRKVSAHRFPNFDDCLRTLADEGELSLEPDAEYPKRMWVVSNGDGVSARTAPTHADSLSVTTQGT